MVTSMLLVALLSVDAGPRNCGGGRQARGCRSRAVATCAQPVYYAPSCSSCASPVIVGTTVVQTAVVQPAVVQPTVIQSTVVTCSGGTCQPTFTAAPVYSAPVQYAAPTYYFARGGCSTCR
jgi:hypothetical protein